MSDEDGMFPIASLNDWERTVVVAELKRPGSVGWYRNPARAAVDSLGITYRDAVGNWRSMHPDFIFFNEVGGKVRASIVDPHGHHLDDSMLKLRGLALFAENHGGEFQRIEVVAKIGTTMRILDLQMPSVREALLRADATPMGLYKSDLAVEYDGRRGSVVSGGASRCSRAVLVPLSRRRVLQTSCRKRSILGRRPTT